VNTPGGFQKLSCVNESGFYALVLRSDREEVESFRYWGTSMVLPAIRIPHKSETRPAINFAVTHCLKSEH
jgi:prophage antirepressor-like protein